MLDVPDGKSKRVAAALLDAGCPLSRALCKSSVAIPISAR